MLLKENKSGAVSTDQDSDCWSDLYRHIKANGSRLVSYFKKEDGLKKAKEAIKISETAI